MSPAAAPSSRRSATVPPDSRCPSWWWPGPPCARRDCCRRAGARPRSGSAPATGGRGRPARGPGRPSRGRPNPDRRAPRAARCPGCGRRSGANRPGRRPGARAGRTRRSSPRWSGKSAYPGRACRGSAPVPDGSAGSALRPRRPPRSPRRQRCRGRRCRSAPRARTCLRSGRPPAGCRSSGEVLHPHGAVGSHAGPIAQRSGEGATTSASSPLT